MILATLTNPFITDRYIDVEVLLFSSVFVSHRDAELAAS